MSALGAPRTQLGVSPRARGAREAERGPAAAAASADASAPPLAAATAAHTACRRARGLGPAGRAAAGAPPASATAARSASDFPEPEGPIDRDDLSARARARRPAAAAGAPGGAAYSTVETRVCPTDSACSPHARHRVDRRAVEHDARARLAPAARRDAARGRTSARRGRRRRRRRRGVGVRPILALLVEGGRAVRDRDLWAPRGGGAGGVRRAQERGRPPAAAEQTT